jgi:hypothetical protein
MNTTTRLLCVLATLCSCQAALASDPEPTAAKPAVAAVPVAPVASPAEAAKPADASSAKPADGQEVKAARVPSGYRAREIDGETVYCRKSTPLGSRFPTEVCMTVAQYEESVRQRDGLRQELTGKQKSYSISQ